MLSSSPPARVGGSVEGPWGTMIRTSKTKSVTISLLKHLNGNPLGTTTTLLGHCVVCEVLATEVS